MSLEHNPIAQLVTQIQNKWKDEVTPFPLLKLVRWLIIPEQARTLRRFLKVRIYRKRKFARHDNRAIDAIYLS